MKYPLYDANQQEVSILSHKLWKFSYNIKKTSVPLHVLCLNDGLYTNRWKMEVA